MPSSLQDRLQTLTRELELSSFLNKGVLQSNDELKLRLAELEAENTALHAAEARLTNTEAERDAALSRVAEAEERIVSLSARVKALAAGERKLKMRLKGLESELEGREGAERELEELREKYEALFRAAKASARILGEATPAGYLPTPASIRAPSPTRESSAVSTKKRPRDSTTTPALEKELRRKRSSLEAEKGSAPSTPATRKRPAVATPTAATVARTKISTPASRRRVEIEIKSEPESDREYSYDPLDGAEDM